MADFHHLGIYLKEKRIEAGQSQAELATVLGYTSSQFVSNWERGICAPPGESLQKMIKLLKLSREKIVTAMVEDCRVEIVSKIYQKKDKRTKKSS
jgi:transcriptional regulator with XRE-family HTH domain